MNAAGNGYSHVLFVTTYRNQKATGMFFSETPMLGVKRAFGTSKNPQYEAFRRLCDILLLAKGEDGMIPEFTFMQADMRAVEFGREICSDDSCLFLNSAMALLSGCRQSRLEVRNPLQ